MFQCEQNLVSLISLSIGPIGRFRVAFPLFQNETSCKTIHVKMSSAYRFIFMQIKFIFM